MVPCADSTDALRLRCGLTLLYLARACCVGIYYGTRDLPIAVLIVLLFDTTTLQAAEGTLLTLTFVCLHSPAPMHLLSLCAAAFYAWVPSDFSARLSVLTTGRHAFGSTAGGTQDSG